MNHYRWDDLALGLKAEFEASFTAAVMQDFAALSGDVNPCTSTRTTRARRDSTTPSCYLPGKYALLQGIDIDFQCALFSRADVARGRRGLLPERGIPSLRDPRPHPQRGTQDRLGLELEG